ncbi:MAG: urease accessory UreF family protein [Pseudomonadota bacterium]
MRTNAAHARLWQLISPALPVGGYSFSQGLETACALGWLADADAAGDWILSVGERNLAGLDLPLLAELWGACKAGESDRWQALNRLLRAHRETAELRDEDGQSGTALLKLLISLELCTTEPWLDDGCPPTFAGAFALATVALDIDRDAALAGYAWVWFENQVAAAIKLVPLGQSEGQRLLLRCGAELDELVSRALERSLSEVGSSLPGLMLASAAHEVQYSRLFRS